MDFLKKTCLLVMMIFMVSCGQNKDFLVKDSDSSGDLTKVLSESGEKLNIFLSLSSGETRDLSIDGDKPTILIFSGEFCLTCREEHNALIDLTNNRPELLTKVNLYTVFIRVNLQKSNILEGRWGITWDTGFDQQNELFSQLGCEQTPCTMVFSPSVGIVYKEEGPFSLDTFVSWTELVD